MVRLRVALAIASLGLPAVAARAQAPARCAPARTALVLSGGAAKGFAHVGVLRVLDSLGLRPDLIVGTSVGALVGALYAGGLTGDEVDSVMRSLPMEHVIRRYEPSVSRSLGLLKPVAVWEKGVGGYRLQAGTAHEGLVNALLSTVTLHGNLLARGDFDSLPIPFHAVATDLLTHRAVVISGGDLAYAVRASIALPLLFTPVRHDTTWWSDGALSANTPIEQARALGAERVWVSRLPYAPADPAAYDDPITLSAALINTLFKEDSSARGVGDVEVINPTYEVDGLDFSPAQADSLIRLGYASARAAFASARCLNPLGAGAAVPAVAPTKVGTVEPTGTGPDASAVLGGLGIVPGRTVDERHVARGFHGIAASERVRAVWLNPGGHGDTVTFRPAIDGAARRVFGVGVAFDQFQSGRLWVGGVDRAAFGLNAEGAAVARFGTYAQDLEAFVRVHTGVPGRHMPLAAGGRLSHESVRHFTPSGELPNEETNEGEWYVGLHDDPEDGAWAFDVLADSRLWREPGRNTRGTVGARIAAFRARGEYEMGTLVEVLAFTDYQRVRVEASRAFTLSGLDGRFRVRVGWGDRLPVQHEFTLGGSDGFAGLRIGDPRGSQEGFAALRLTRRVAPQLSATLEAMTGAVGVGNGFLARRDSTDFGQVYGGVRAGVEVATPIGPIRIEEGFANTGSRALLVRVGYWF